MTSRERVIEALNHGQPDHTPCDFFATPEIFDALCRFFRASGDHELRRCLGTDLRYIEPPYTGPALPSYDDGSEMNIWGILRRPMPNEYGDYAEPVNLPYAGWTSVKEAERFPWPDPDWFDYGAVKSLCAEHPDRAIATGSFAVQDFINSVAYGRGVEQTLLDIASENPVYIYIVMKRHSFYLQYVERILEAAEGRIDLVLCGDDFGTQRDLLISPRSFDRIFAPLKREFFDMVHAHGAKVLHHSCGSTVKLIPRFIDIGLDALQTIQPRAAGMNPYELKRRFEGSITLHGGVDVQGWLQETPPSVIEREVVHLMEEVGRGGGYILSPSHNIQPDTPLEHVLAVYRAVARYRGGDIVS